GVGDMIGGRTLRGRTLLWGLALSALALGAIPGAPPLAAPGQGQAQAQAQVQAPAAQTGVEIRDFGFHPGTLTIAPGTVVTWTNKDDELHTVAATDRSYHSAPMDTGERYSRAFAAPGEYRYFCTLHPHMQGVVIVRAPSAALAAQPMRGS